MPDIADTIDAAIPAAPPEAPALDDTLVLGRRALRRRRMAYGVGAAATALVIGGTAWAVASADRSPGVRDDAPVADQQSEEERDAQDTWGAEELVRSTEDGTFEVNPRAEVQQTSDISVGEKEAHVWVLKLGGTTYYVLGQRNGSIASAPAGTQGLDVGEWATQLLDPDSVLPADDQWVRFDNGSHVIGLDGVEVVEQVADPGLGDNFAAPGDPTAVAEVVRNATTYFLAVRSLDGGLAEVVPYRKDGRITTLEEFLDYAQQQYATNDEGGSEGMR